MLLTLMLTSVRAFGESSKHFKANSFPVAILLHNLKRDADITTAVTIIYFFAFVISGHELNIDCIYKYNNYLIIIHDCLAHKQHNVIDTLI